MRRERGFTLLELLIVVAILLIIAALAIPGLIRSRIAANEAGAAASIRILNSAQISYYSAYPSVGYATSLAALGGTNCSPPTSTSACLIDTVLSTGLKSGYSFVLPASSVTGTPGSSYQLIASPTLFNITGIRSFCSYADATVRVSQSSIATCDGTVDPLD